MEEDRLLMSALCRAPRPGVMLRRNMNQEVLSAQAQIPGLPCVLVLAAGRGERFRASGGRVHKLDAPLDGQPVLWHAMRAVQAAGLD